MSHQSPYFNRACLLAAGVLSMTIFGVGLSASAQNQGKQGDIIVIGDSPSEWSKFNRYWQQLLQQNTTVSTSSSSAATQTAANPNEDPEALKAKLIKNLKVTGLKLQPILKLNGSSQLIGTLKNGNSESVTVSSVSFEILDEKGNFLQSGSASPEPSTLAPGQAATFKTDLLGLVPDPTYNVRLTPAPFTLQGGV